MARDDGVSTVLGAVLVFALILTFLVTVRVSYAPVWQEEDEAAMMSEVQGQFAAIKAEADRQAANVTSQPVGLPVTLLERQASRFFSPPNIPGALSFQPGTADVTMSTNEFLVLQQDGQSLGGVDETWEEAGTAVENVATVQHLRLRLLDPGSASDGDGMTLTVRDSDDDLVGTLEVRVETFASGYGVKTRVTTDTGTVLYDQGESFFSDDQPAFYWVDALDPELHFRDLISVEGAMEFSFTEQSMDGQYTMTYRDDSGVVQGGSGRLTLDWGAFYIGGALHFESSNQQFVHQELLLENGAVLLTQTDGDVVRIPPFIQVDRAGGDTILRMTVPSLIGDADSVTSTGSATAILDGTLHDALLGTAPRWHIDLETAFPEAWADHWERALSAAGLDTVAGEYTVTHNTTHVQIDVFGATTAPASTLHDLSIELYHAAVDVRLQT